MKTYKLTTKYGEIFIQDSEGQGAACMLLHGNSQSSNEFKQQFAALGGKYRLIAWDLPGHGQSDKLANEKDYNIETYAEIGRLIIDNLAMDLIALFGWSLGGHVAIEMIKNMGNKIQALMITGTPPCELSKEGFQKAFKWNPEISRLVTTENWTEEDAKLWINYGGLDAEKYQEAVDTALKTDGRSRTNMINHLSTRGDNQLIDIENFNGPVEIVIGGTDKHINNEYIRSHVKNLKLFRGFIELPGVGHTPFLEQPSQFNQHFDEFMSKLKK